MTKYLFVLGAIALSPTTWAGWVFLTNNSHGANDYYYAPLDGKGKPLLIKLKGKVEAFYR